MLMRVPVGMAMGLVGVSGFAYLVGGQPALKIVGHTSMRTVTDYTFGVIPMFLLMGAFVSNSGMSRELFRAANAFVGHFRGGLGIATIAACAGFAAISGSSVATAATFATVAYPEMRRYGLSAIVRHRRDRRRRHARRHAAAFDRACGLRHHHRAGHRQAVHRRHHSGTACRFDGHTHRRHHRPAAAGFPAHRAAPLLEGALCRTARHLGDAAAVRLCHRRALWRPVHADRSRRHGCGRRASDRGGARQAERGWRSAVRCCRRCAPPLRYSRC